ncbi:hypothetical protein GCM10028777_23790 [Angustibacter speluncae]
MDRAARAALFRALALAGAAGALAVAGALLGRAPDPRLVREGHDVRSPSGRYAARVDVSTADDGTRLWCPVVVDERGVEVFRSEGHFASGKGLTVTWEPGLDTLWIVAAEVGTFFVQEGPTAWSATALTRATADLLPAEVRAMRGD